MSRTNRFHPAPNLKELDVRSVATTIGILASLAFPAWASKSHAQKPITVQGTITTAPSEKGTFTVQPQGTKVPADVVKIATDAKTTVTIASETIKVADLKVGMWVRAEMADGIARKIVAGHLWVEEGDKLVLFQGLPPEFFTYPAGFDVNNEPTKFGPLRMMYRLTGNGSYLRWGRKALPKEGMVVCWPTSLKARFSHGPPVKPDDQGLIHLPADVSELRVWFLDPVVPKKDDGKVHDNSLRTSAVDAKGLADPVEAVARGRQFLVDLFDPGIGLLPEFRGSDVFWLYHDNYLAAKVLDKSHPEVAQKILKAIHSFGIKESGKIEIVFGEAKRPLPFRHYQLVEVRRVGGKVVKTEIVTEKEMNGWEGYADLLLLAALAEEDAPKAKQHFQQALQMWDGKGFKDRAAQASNEYATYKLALALIAAHKLKERPVAIAPILERLLAQQAKDGGWITDYDKTGKPVGVANVETTSLAILAVEAATK